MIDIRKNTEWYIVYLDDKHEFKILINTIGF